MILSLRPCPNCGINQYQTWQLNPGIIRHFKIPTTKPGENSLFYSYICFTNWIVRKKFQIPTVFNAFFYTCFYFFFFWIFFYIERDKYNYKYLWKIPFAIIILAHLIGLFYKSLSVVKILRIYIILVLISFFRHPFSTISNPYFI